MCRKRLKMIFISLQGVPFLGLSYYRPHRGPTPVEFHKINFNSTKNTSATLTFVRNNFAS